MKQLAYPLFDAVDVRAALAHVVVLNANLFNCKLEAGEMINSNPRVDIAFINIIHNLL